ERSLLQNLDYIKRFCNHYINHPNDIGQNVQFQARVLLLETAKQIEQDAAREFYQRRFNDFKPDLERIAFDQL
ncbi:MAG: hypothetical protein ACE5Q6_08050, partial [Dehalococcoidia bacterium]